MADPLSWTRIAAYPLESFFAFVALASLFVLMSNKSHPKRKWVAGPLLLVSTIMLGFLTSHDFRAELFTKMGLNPWTGDCIAWAIHQAGINGFDWTSEMTGAFVIAYAAAFVAHATGTRKLGWMIALGTTAFLIAKLWGFIQPFLVSMGCS